MKTQKIRSCSQFIYDLKGGIMKRTIIRSGVMVVVVLAVAIGISAQGSPQYRADIPFSFEAGGRQHSAGEYRVGEIGSGVIGLLNLESGKMRIVGISAQPGANDWSDRGTVTFLKTNDGYRLTEISTPSFNLKMRVKKMKGNVADLASAGRVVKIYLD